MIHVDTGIDLIYRFDQFLDESLCDEIVEHIKTKSDLLSYHNDPANVDKDPFSYDYPLEKYPADLKKRILEYKDNLTSIVSDCYKEKNYPDSVNTIYWRKGKSMDWHPDVVTQEMMSETQNKAHNQNSSIFTRNVTAITYLNDDYIGGETVIGEGKWVYPGITNTKTYLSKPKKGSVVLYFSGCFHSVNEIIEGDRFTISIFFTKELERSMIDN
jgi:predicted 2-oxoglutarate/Fe(II)-dependent dioxygenase YbiX